ncbi:MAG: L,D-transpeptidase family protein [Aestuariivirga sp.]
MRNTRSKIVLGLFLSLAMAGTALADSKPIFKQAPRKPNFFEQLFGGGSNRDNKPNWWQRQEMGPDGVRVLYGNQGKMNALADGAEPAPLPGLGMGNLTYVPLPTQSVFDVAFAKLPSTTPDADAIRNLLADKATNIRAVDVEKKAILAFYAARSFKPVWTENGQATPRVDAVLKLFAKATDDGLLPVNYQPEILSGFDNPQAALGTDADKLAKFDVELTAAALKFGRNISGGQFDPNRLSRYHDMKPESANADTTILGLADAAEPAAYLESLAPKNPQYAVFKAALAKLNEQASTPITKVAFGPAVKRGKSDERLPAVRERLVQLGFLTKDSETPADPKILDDETSIALMAMQTSIKLKPTGNLDDKTIKVMNFDASDDHRVKLVDNMERLRWLPKNLGERHVFVNQAAFEVNVMDHGASVWKSRVVVGKPMTQTYAFSDQISTVVFNPTWGVPASIIINEYGPKSRRDPSYLDNQGFVVTDQNGNQVSSSSVDWWGMGKNPKFGVQQPAGAGNALGELKFLFPNAHDIYMHDTPSKELFASNMRAFSHGCVRVQNPRMFAQTLLGWDADKVASNIEQGDSHSVALPQKVPVHLTYFTAWADADGKIQYYDDIYGRDASIQKAFSGMANNRKLQNDGNIVAQTGDAPKVDGSLTQN